MTISFRGKPTPYELEVNTLEAQLVGSQGSQRELLEQEKGARAKVGESQDRMREIAAASRAMNDLRSRLQESSS